MFYINFATIFCLVIVLINLNGYHMKAVDSVLQNAYNLNIPTWSNQFFDFNSFMKNLFPNFNDEGGYQSGINPGNGYFNNPLNRETNNQLNNYPRYLVNNWDNDNWNNNMYPGANPNGPSYPNTQVPSYGIWNNGNGLTTKWDPNSVSLPGKGIQQNLGLNQGITQYPNQGFVTKYPDSQSSENQPQVADGLSNNVANVKPGIEDLVLRFPEDNYQGSTTTTEKIAILGLPVIISTERTSVPTTSAPTSVTTSSAMRQCTQDCPSTSEYNPVCGTDNVTYFNEGKFRCARICGIDVSEKRKGACEDVF